MKTQSRIPLYFPQPRGFGKTELAMKIIKDQLENPKQLSEQCRKFFSENSPIYIVNKKK